MLKEHPILFSTEMAKAILEGRKTMTRRVVKPQPVWKERDMKLHISTGWNWSSRETTMNGWKEVDEFNHKLASFCPYGQVGDRLWVRETHYLFGHWMKREFKAIGKCNWEFKEEVWGEQLYSDESPKYIQIDRSKRGWFKRPSIFMPRKYSRITLEITNIRVERVQEISYDDAVREGMEVTDAIVKIPITNFRVLWDFINAKRGYPWGSNPWVWVIEFKKI